MVFPGVLFVKIGCFINSPGSQEYSLVNSIRFRRPLKMWTRFDYFRGDFL